MYKKLFLAIIILHYCRAGAEATNLQEKTRIVKEWYQTYYPQEDNQKAAFSLVKGLIECKINKQINDEPSNACLAIKEHIANFMMEKQRLAEKIMFDFEGLKLERAFCDSVETDILFDFSDNDDKSLLIYLLVDAPIEELTTIVKDIMKAA